MSFPLAAGLASGLAAIGFAAHWLTGRGTIAAAAVGTLVFFGAGIPGALLLGTFFVSGSLLTRWNAPVGSRRSTGRNARQVLANGAWVALGALLARVDPLPGWALFTGALASAQADTWATEIGARSRRPPRLILSGAPVPAGTSGGVTPAGTMGGMFGGLLLAGLALAMGAPRTAALAGLAGGIMGMLLDSVLGATVQGRFHCPACGVSTEHRRHACGSRTHAAGGWAWLDNDGVNLIANGTAAALALLLCCWD